MSLSLHDPNRIITVKLQYVKRNRREGYAARQAHLSFGPGEAAISRFRAELAGFKTGKVTVQLRYDEALPADLIRRMAAFCLSAAAQPGA